ncbi:DUF2071 domain-containing protein [Parapedobacter sp. DT-150]|uniref:DUF2071 domain-containing protein n=1 Tax=Parapedobacter sp. DT-150 TaxID=3396162 RepID=UPI003F1CE72E
MKMLKNHPFAVDAFFEHSLVLTFAMPKAQLAGMIPECLELDVLRDEWGFLAVAMVQARGLRPAHFPKWIGSDFFLIGYRIFVRYRTRAGKRLRGLYILKSETDNGKMALLGNIFTHYAYTTTDICQAVTDKTKTVHSEKSCLEVSVLYIDGEVPLPSGSPFADWKDARKFAGPMPYTFGYDAAKKEVVIVEGVRQNWEPAPLTVSNYSIGFFGQLQLSDTVLAGAFEVSNIPYHWKKGRVEKWK